MISTLTAQAAALSSEHSTFGQLPDGSAVEKYTLRNSHGVQASIITYGATLQSAAGAGQGWQGRRHRAGLR